METPGEWPSPEGLAVRLARRLKRHAWWDLLLVALPPLCAVIFIGALPYGATWISGTEWILVAAALAAAAVFGALNRLRALAWSVPRAARLIDQKVAGQDRFVTLATINPSVCSPLLLSRLRQEAAALAQGVTLGRAFPYRLKRSFFQSLILSLCVILISLLLPRTSASLLSETLSRELMRAAQQLSQAPGFSELARKIEALAARLQEPSLSAAEKRALIQELLYELERERAAKPQAGGAGSELLEQAGDALRRLEQSLEQAQGSGANSSGGQSAGRKEDSRGDREKELAALQGRDYQGQKPDGEEKAQGERQSSGQQAEGNRDRGKQKDEKGAGKEAGAGRVSREPGAQLAADRPAERFLKPGEVGEKGIKGARFVTVELPEPQTAGEGGASPLGQGRRKLPKSAVGNVPLARPDKAEAGAEKQPLPLEYRGLIR
jgi:hypothetical protein